MANQFNPLDPLGIIKATKNQIDTMAVRAGLPPTPSVPGLQQRTNEERAIVHRERFPEGPEPVRGTGVRRVFDPLGLLSGTKSEVQAPGYSHDRGL